MKHRFILFKLCSCSFHGRHFDILYAPVFSQEIIKYVSEKSKSNYDSRLTSTSSFCILYA